MSFWTSGRVGEALGTAAPGPEGYSAVVTDSRTLPAGALFVALRGERFDGHAFLPDVKGKGALGAVVRRDTPPVDGLPLYPVEDTLAALGRLAAYYRRHLNLAGPVVAVTGTNGKTSTKQMIAAVLRPAFRVHATARNLNNLIGVPLTILGAPADAGALVVEAGANRPGEIPTLRDIIQPDISVITNVGAGHLAGFGSIERVLEEKLVLVRDVGLAVVGTDPPSLAERARELARTVTAGLETTAQVHPDRVTIAPDGRATLEWRGAAATLPFPGRHLVANAMLALACAQEIGIDRETAVGALETVTLPEGRSQLVPLGRLTVLNDCYNANPASVRAALDTLDPMRSGRRTVVVVGTMLELGPESAAWHRRLAEEILARRPDLIAAVGEFAAAFEPHRARLGGRLLTALDAEALGPQLKAALRGDEVVLLKASRGVELERVLRHLNS